MDPISEKILNAKEFREKAEAEKLRAEQERLAKLRAKPEYQRFERFKAARERYFMAFKERCLIIQTETKDVEEKYRLNFNPLSLNEANRDLTHFTATIDETRLSIQLDPSGDEAVDFFGSITVLGEHCARKTFFVLPSGDFRVFADESDPSDYYMLFALLKSGARAEESSFTRLLDEGLNALTALAFEGCQLPPGWTYVRVGSPLVDTDLAKLTIDTKEFQRLAVPTNTK
jgi:hypothetical protein